MSFIAKDGAGTNFNLASHIDTGNGIHYPANMLPNRPMISQFADSLGTGLGTVDLIGDYSGAATDFWIEPPAGEVWHIFRLIGYMRFGSALRADRYGGAALTNGVKLIHEVSSSERDLTSQRSVLHLAEWGAYCHDFTEHSFGSGDNFATWRWSFNRSGVALFIDGDNNDKVIIRLNDNFSATGVNLVEHHFLFQGHKLVGS